MASLYRAAGKAASTESLIHAVLHLEQRLTTGSRRGSSQPAGWGAWQWLRTLCPAGGGWQDQVGGLVPGIKIGRSKAQLPLRVEVEKIPVPDGFTQTLNDHLLLVYTGKTRLARNLLQVMPACPWVPQPLLPPQPSLPVPFGGAEHCHPNGSWHRRLRVQLYLPGCCWSQEDGDGDVLASCRMW